ncbi:MAG: hypothetical protein ACI8UO_000880 [Verrucomicrobiales bacterium]|jgi:hypothetical protein
MIQVSLVQVIVLYLVLVLGGLFVLWVINQFSRGVRRRRLRKFQVVCQVCGCHYEDRSGEHLPNCPECGRPNEREPVSEI